MVYLHQIGIFVWRNNTGMAKMGGRMVRFGLKGSADIIGLLPDGRFLAVECKKTKSGVISEEQKNFREKIEKNNGLYILAKSVTDVMNVI